MRQDCCYIKYQILDLFGMKVTLRYIQHLPPRFAPFSAKIFKGNKTRSANVFAFSMYDHSEDILCTLDMLSLRNTKYPSTNALFTFTANMSIRIYMK